MSDPIPPLLAAALVKAQAKFKAVRKAGNGNYGAYAKFDDLVDDTRDILAENGLAISQWPSHDFDGRPTLTSYLIHESGETLSHSMLLLLGKTDPAGQGSGITYARRYAWQAILGIAAEADDDGQAAQPPAPARNTRKAAAPRDDEPPPEPGTPPKVDTSAAVKRVQTLYSDLSIPAAERLAVTCNILALTELGTHNDLNMAQLNKLQADLNRRKQALNTLTKEPS